MSRPESALDSASGGDGRRAAGRPRVVFLGMPCAFSGPPLAALLAAGVEVAAVVLPGPPGVPFRWHRPAGRRRSGGGRSRGGGIPTAGRDDQHGHGSRSALGSSPGEGWGEENIADAGWVADGTSGAGPAASVLGIAMRAAIPVLFAGSVRDEAVVGEVAALGPDAIAVACFPERLPRAILALPPLGAMNVHPSLLPRDRGPSPLFWVFHRGAEETGVTVHLMDERLDAGPILRQRAVPIPEGTRLVDLERRLASLGGELLVDALTARAAGDTTATTQDERLATSAPAPRPEDSVVDPATWSARRAVRFVTGVGAGVVRDAQGARMPVVAARHAAACTGVTSEAGEQGAQIVSFGDGPVTFVPVSGQRTG